MTTELTARPRSLSIPWTFTCALAGAFGGAALQAETWSTGGRAIALCTGAVVLVLGLAVHRWQTRGVAGLVATCIGAGILCGSFALKFVR